MVEPFDRYVTKSRPTYGLPKKVQVKTTVLQKSDIRKSNDKEELKLKFTPLVKATVIRKPTTTPNILLRNEGYALNRTQSTGGIAAKVSLELKKKYLLGESAMPGNIQKSGSVSTLDSKFKSFHSNITDCQKLLKPAPEISASMKTFCSKLDERTSPLSPTFLSQSPTFFNNSNNAKTNLSNTISTETIAKNDNKNEEPPGEKQIFENETEGRPRSPLHETSIVVPEINWLEHKNDKKVDSLDETSSTESISSEEDKKSKSSNIFANIPRVEVHDDAGLVLNEDEIPFDSLNTDVSCDTHTHSSDAPKSITNEKKTLNQPKPVPTVESYLAEVHKHTHTQTKTSSGRSTPSPVNDSCADQATAALTETELSDWARDDAVSDDYEEFNKDDGQIKNECVNIAKIQELEDLSRISDKFRNKNVEVTECVNSILNPSNLDNIEFMDNGTETSSEDDNGNNGYIQLENEEDLMDSLNIVEAINPDVNSAIVIVETTNPIVAANVISQNQLMDNKDVGSDHSHNDKDSKPRNGTEKIPDDSLCILEAGTTTEENTCSDSTVKNITEKLFNKVVNKLNNEQSNPDEHNQSVEYEEHCQRLASKVEFGNAKDSIDIRKSKRKSKNDQQHVPDLIQEEKEQITISKFYKKEEIEKERDKNQKLIQEMVMNKMKAQNKSLERKKRNKSSFTTKPYDLAKSATTDLSIELKNNYNGTSNKNVIHPPDLITIIALQKSETVSNFNAHITNTDTTRPLSVRVPKYTDNVLKIVNNSDSTSLPNINQHEDFKIAKPLFSSSRASNDMSVNKNDKHDEQIGISNSHKFKQQKSKKSKENIYIEDSIESLVLNTERRNSLLYSNDTLSKKRNNLFRRSKSGEDHPNLDRLSIKLDKPERKSVPDFGQFKTPNITSTRNNSHTHHKSDPNLLINGVDGKKDKRNKKDLEHRKSFTKFLSDIFTTKKKDGCGTSTTNKGGIFSKISPKTKGKSKVNSL